MNWAARWIRGLADVLVVLIGIFLVTGGTILHFPHAKIEFSSLELWVAGLLLLAVIWTRGLKLPLEKFGGLGKLHSWTLSRLRSRKSSRKAARALILGVFVLLWITHILRHLRLQNDGCDVSMVHQPLFYPWGHPPLHADFSRMGTALSEHILYSFFLLAPLTSAFKSDFLIYAIQAALIGLPLFWLVTRGPLREAPQAMFFGAILLLAYKALRNSVVWDFREDAIAYAALIGMFLALRSRRWLVYSFLLLIAILSKENIFVITFLYAFPILLSGELPLNVKERRTAAALTAVVSLAYGVLAFKVLIPIYTNHDQGHALFARYGDYGHTVSEIVANVLTTPRIWGELLPQVFNRSGIVYLVFLLLPLVPFMKEREVWIWLIPASIGILMNVAHRYYVQRMMIFHYELIIFPFLFIALLIGMRNALRTQKYGRVCWVLALSFCVFGRSPMWGIQEFFPNVRAFQTSRALHDLQTEERVAVDERLSAQVNHLPHIKIFLPNSGDPRWSVGEDSRLLILDQDAEFEKALTEKELARGAQIVWGTPGVSRAVVLRRR